LHYLLTILQAALSLRCRLSQLTEMSTRNISWE